MPKFLVTMNIVETKVTSFIIETDNEDDIHDAFSETEFDCPFFDENCKWVTSDYYPPEINNTTEITRKSKIKQGVCTKTQNNKIQKLFDKTIQRLDKENV